MILLDTHQENFWFSHLFRHPQLASPETS
jgi:hypothetical protein